MFDSLRSSIRSFFLPLHDIARELRIANELKELELAARVDKNGNPSPIYRVTETPGRNDTQVTYAGESPSSRAEAMDEVLANALDEVDD